MALNKLHKKDFTIAVKTGTDANSTKFAKEAVKGELYLATDTGTIYKSTSDAGVSDATIIASNNLNGSPLYGFSASINDQTGTAYTLLSSDNGKVVVLDNASAVTVTVPSGLGAGFNCSFVQKGAGQVSFSASSTTINNRQSHTKINAQYGVASLLAYAADTFVLAGDTAS